MGGALAQVFAAALAANHPELAGRVRGIYTYGMPRVGDAAFSTAMEKQYPQSAFRLTHAADIIPLASILGLLLILNDTSELGAIAFCWKLCSKNRQAD